MCLDQFLFNVIFTVAVALPYLQGGKRRGRACAKLLACTVEERSHILDIIK